MSTKKARYHGPSQTGVDASIPVGEGEFIHVHVPHGGEVPTEVDGRPVPTEFRDKLLEQGDAWTEVNRPAADEGEAEKSSAKTATASTKGKGA